MCLRLSVYPAGELGKAAWVGGELGITLIIAKCFYYATMKGTSEASKCFLY